LQRFFAKDPPDMDPHFHDNPPRLPMRQLPPISKELINPLIQKVASKSAPGQSGHTWTIIKWAWEANVEHFLELFEACLSAGHHPRQWKEAVVCVIPKLNCTDYTLAKNFRPITLLECIGKLLEKVVAKLIYSKMDKNLIMPTNQYGGRNALLTLDAGLALMHDIQSAHQARLHCGLLLFNIQGFFDNINHEQMVQTLTNFGFAPEIVNWCRSFLQDHMVRLRFNGRNSDSFDFTVGTPQGSPVSPVLSIIYTAPLLHKMKSQANPTLGMYIDDGVIFACSKAWRLVENALRDSYSSCIEWLARVGLNAELEKTELIFFKKPKERQPPPITCTSQCPLQTHITG
jgi:hypothetical protein